MFDVDPVHNSTCIHIVYTAREVRHCALPASLRLPAHKQRGPAVYCHLIWNKYTRKTTRRRKLKLHGRGKQKSGGLPSARPLNVEVKCGKSRVEMEMFISEIGWSHHDPRRARDTAKPVCAGGGGGGGGEKVIKKVIKKVINRRKRSQTPFTAWVGAAETPSHSPK